MMPAAGTLEANSLWNAPRPLKEPLTWSDSSFSASGRRSPSEPSGSSSAGVRRTYGRMRLQAASTSLRTIMGSGATAGQHVTQEVVEIGRRRARVLGGFVVAAQLHGFFMLRMAAEGLDLVGRHRPALQAEAAHRIGRKLAEIVGLDRTEIALGRDMQADGLAHLGTETFCQPLGAEFLVHIVDAAAGRILAKRMDHVADIVQQRGQHGRRRAIVGFGECRRLQRVLQLVDRAQSVAARRATGEDVQKFLAQGIAHAPFLARTVCGYPGIMASACLSGSAAQARVTKSPCISHEPQETKAMVPGVKLAGSVVV